MRPILHGDVVAAARVLFAAPPGRRAGLMRALLDRAGWADAYRRHAGRAHPFWGDGSLMSAALALRPGPEPGTQDDDYCACLCQVLEAVVARRAGQRGG